MVFPHALFPVYGWDLFPDSSLHTTHGGREDKVMAGGTPANPAVLVVQALVVQISKGRIERPSPT
jgi:hypothetical protein